MSNDVYLTARAWLSPTEGGPDLKLNAICPALDKQIRKYSEQAQRLIRETPELYETVVLPFIEAQPASGIQWSVT